MKKITLLSLALSGLMLANAAKTPAVSKGEALVNKLLNGQGTITQTFDAVSGLKGYVVKAGSGSSTVVFTDKNGQYLFSGVLVDKNGQNLTQMYVDKYITSKVAGPAYADAANTAWLQDGDDKAPHKLYVVIEPNCIYCHKLFDDLRPQIDNGTLQVRWILVAFRRPESAGMAAAILGGSDSKAQVDLLKQNESGFNDQQEIGGIKAVTQSATNQGVFAKITANTAYFSKYGFQGTPVILYHSADGKSAFVPGYVQGAQLTSLINSTASTW